VLDAPRGDQRAELGGPPNPATRVIQAVTNDIFLVEPMEKYRTYEAASSARLTAASPGRRSSGAKQAMGVSLVRGWKVANALHCRQHVVDHVEYNPIPSGGS
jgi:hypothetical protein